MSYVAYVVYYTTSTDEQDLGIQAQKDSVHKYVKDKGYILVEFEEHKSGASKVRPEFAKAVETAKTHKAILIAAKLDKLS